MDLWITETTGGNLQRMRCTGGRGARLHARAAFVRVKGGPWHS